MSPLPPHPNHTATWVKQHLQH